MASGGLKPVTVRIDIFLLWPSKDFSQGQEGEKWGGEDVEGTRHDNPATKQVVSCKDKWAVRSKENLISIPLALKMYLKGGEGRED